MDWFYWLLIGSPLIIIIAVFFLYRGENVAIYLKRKFFTAKTLCIILVIVLLVVFIVDTIIFSDTIRALKAANDLIIKAGGEPESAASAVVSYIFNSALKILATSGIVYLLWKRIKPIKSTNNEETDNEEVEYKDYK